ncbi:uncharacterized protein LOC134741589 [Cydia strobilella]|uniref:uncharacterized protein LOC134741589 n=1 Tax=Cydia strobilella TaxID=1100964 RepID=UPI00300444CE
MAPGNNERHPSHTGTIPKTKARNNCNVPQEAVTPTRRDMASNLVSTSLDWVPVSEYNSRTNYNQSRKQTNNTSDQELNDLENSVSFESGFGRFVPVRPQPRALPLNVQNRENLSNEHQDDASSMSGHTLHPYAHQMQNGLVPHSNHANHAAAAVMIVNPTTPNAVTANMSQPFNAPNQNRKNLTNNLNPARNNLDGNHSSHNNAASSRPGTKTVNLMNNMYDPQVSMNNVNENNHVHRESARALGEAIVAACPDTAAVERRLGQIREYIRVTSSLVDTMRNSEDEAYIEHTKEEYDELVEMVMKLKESETKLEKVLNEEPDNVEVPAEEADAAAAVNEAVVDKELPTEIKEDEPSNASKQDGTAECTTLKKVTNLENEQLNKSLQSVKNCSDHLIPASDLGDAPTAPVPSARNYPEDDTVEIKEIESIPCEEITHDRHLNEVLRKNIISCVEKVAIIEEMKNKNCSNIEDQDVVVRPVSVQSNGSAYSESELWQNEIKNKMELSQRRLTALKQQQKRLIKYQEEAKQQLEEINRERQSQEALPSTSHDNFGGIQNHQMNGNYNRMYAANQIGVATTLPHSNENVASRANSEHGHNQDDRFSHRDANIASSEEALGANSDAEDALLTERGRALQAKLRELQLKKQHMENLVSEFQKLQMATHLGSNNTYSSSGEDSADEPTRKCNKSGGNIKNEDPFKLMEIKAIKTALQKTKDLMRSVENYESDHLSGAHDDSFQMPSHSNINDNKSEGGGSIGGWSNDGSVCRVRNSLPQRHKFTNEQHEQQHLQQQQHMQQQQQHMPHLQQQQHMPQPQHMPHPQQMSHESNIASLQELAQELRMETEKIVGERTRIKDMLSNKETSRKQKMVNEQASTSSGWHAAGPAERRQLQLRALLADKQRELDKLLNKEKVLCGNAESQKMMADSCTGSIITGINQSYNSEQEEPDSRSEQILLDSQNSRDTDNFRVCGQGGLSTATLPSRRASACCSDSDSASRTKSNARSRARRRQTQDRLSEDNNVPQSNNSSHSLRHEPRAEPSNINLVPPISQNVDNPINMPYPHMPPPYWNNTNKTNQDMRTNQFTQNSHSQTMERLMGAPQMSFPPSVPFNMMMPYGGMVPGCGCGCGLWGAWCWQQLLQQQRELHALRDHLSLLEERWRAETASHTLNNQVAPGNRANNYWDNFRSYSRQNLLSANSKTNADGHLGGLAAAPLPQPLVSRSHNALRRAPPPPPPAPAPSHVARRAAPDVLNLHHAEPQPQPQPHSNNLHAADKRKSCSKLPAKNSRAAPLSTGNLHLQDNPNLASARRDVADKATSKLFDLLRENVYSEVTTLIGVNESHPDFLIQLFKELQLISSDPLRQRVLQSIRGVLSQYGSAPEGRPGDRLREEAGPAAEGDSADRALSAQAGCSTAPHFDNNIVRFLLLKSEEICTPELMDSLATHVLNGGLDGRRPQISKKRLLEFLSKYEGMTVCSVSNDIIESLPLVISGGGGGGEGEAGEAGEPPPLQDVAGSLSLFSASDPALHACPYDMWPGHVHVDVDGEPGEASPRGREDKVDLLDCSEMHNGDLAEADQSCEAAEALPDVVDTEEAAPAEADAEWVGLDRVPTRLHLGESSEKQKGDVNIM